MEAIFLAKRALINIPKIFPQRPACYPHSTTKISRSCCSTTAFERAEGNNAVEESRGSGNSSMPVREGMMEVRQRVLDGPDEKPPGNTSSFAADTAKDGIRKATEMAENVEETAKGTLDGAWKAGREGLQGIQEAVSDDQIKEDPAVGEIENVEQPVDTQEYRGIEELKGKKGGFLRGDDD
ncbi:hypothetical protein SLA2020_042940 [Shorea laevis]